MTEAEKTCFYLYQKKGGTKFYDKEGKKSSLSFQNVSFQEVWHAKIFHLSLMVDFKAPWECIFWAIDIFPTQRYTLAQVL